MIYCDVQNVAKYGIVVCGVKQWIGHIINQFVWQKKNRNHIKDCNILVLIVILLHRLIIAFNLKDPLSHCQIDTPVRGINCDHLECIDFTTYLRYANESGIWQCPICSQSLLLDEIRVDEKMQQFLHRSMTFDLKNSLMSMLLCYISLNI